MSVLLLLVPTKVSLLAQANEEGKIGCGSSVTNTNPKTTEEFATGTPKPISDQSAGVATESITPEIIGKNVATTTSPVNIYQSPALPLKNCLVVIDSGHGGRDPGAESRGFSPKLIEASINWDIAVRVYYKVQALGCVPVLTVKNDKYDIVNHGTPPPDAYKSVTFADKLGGGVYNHGPGLYRRVDFANRALEFFAKKGFKVIFISIHIDSMRSRSGRRIGGIHILYPKSQSGNELANTLNSVFSLSPDLRRKSGDKLFEPIHETGRDIIILRGMSERTKIPNKIKNRVVIEVGNLANPEDCKKLSTPDYREDVASRIARGIYLFFTNEK